MKTFQTKELSQERIDECVNFVKTSLDMDFDSYLDFFHKNYSYCGRIIFDYFTLPKTDLHKEFKEKICKSHKEIRTKALEDREYQRIIDIGKSYAPDLSDRSEGKYNIINKYDLVDDQILCIGIPYEKLEQGKGHIQKFAHTTNISKKNTPNLYEKIINNVLSFNP